MLPVLFAAVLSLVSPSDEPQVRADVPSFGQRGQLVLRGSTNANVVGYHQRLKVAGTTLTGDSLSFSVEPSLGIFIVDNLLLGGLIDVNYGYASGAYSVGAAVGPYVGYRLPMGAVTSFLPTLTALYDFSRDHVKTQDGTGALSSIDLDTHEITLRVALDFVFHVAPRVSLTAGPFVSQSVYSHNSRSDVAQDSTAPMQTTYGLRAGILGWL
jgi:hypothetical protein